MIYLPAEDSYLIEKEVRRYSKSKSVLDIGSGSGILAKAAQESGAKSVLAVDINSEAVSYIKQKGIKTIRSDLFSKVKEKFDLIAFNPPYLPEDKREDKESALATTGGKAGDEIILRFLKKVKNHLNKAGIVLLLLSSLTPRTRILKELKKQELVFDVIASQKIFMEKLEVWKIADCNLAD